MIICTARSTRGQLRPAQRPCLKTPVAPGSGTAPIISGRLRAAFVRGRVFQHVLPRLASRKAPAVPEGTEVPSSPLPDIDTPEECASHNRRCRPASGKSTISANIDVQGSPTTWTPSAATALVNKESLDDTKSWNYSSSGSTLGFASGTTDLGSISELAPRPIATPHRSPANASEEPAL